MYKKILLVVLGCMLISSVCLAYKGVACEPESDNSVSYVVADANSIRSISHNMMFVKRTDIDNNDEYWIRVRVTTDQDRFLYYASVVIDGVEHRLNKIKNMNRDYAYTGYSIRENMLEDFPCEYYSLPNDLTDKIKMSTEFYFVLNKMKIQGVKFSPNKNFVTDIKTIIGLTYADKDKYWQPNLAK